MPYSTRVQQDEHQRLVILPEWDARWERPERIRTQEGSPLLVKELAARSDVLRDPVKLVLGCGVDAFTNDAEEFYAEGCGFGAWRSGLDLIRSTFDRRRSFLR